MAGPLATSVRGLVDVPEDGDPVTSSVGDVDQVAVNCKPRRMNKMVYAGGRAVGIMMLDEASNRHPILGSQAYYFVISASCNEDKFLPLVAYVIHDA